MKTQTNYFLSQFLCLRKIIELLICSLLIIQLGCKKSDYPDFTEIQINKSEKIALEKFFFQVDTTDATLIKAVNKLKETPLPKGYIINFTKRLGFPVWDKVIRYSKESTPTVNSYGGSNPNDTILIIPLVLENGNYVTGYIQANISDTITLFYKSALEYVDYPFITSNGSEMSANQYALRYMHLNKEVFGYTRFKINDNRLFSTYGDSSLHQTFIQLQTNSLNSTTSYFNSITSCFHIPYTYICGICGEITCEYSVQSVYVFCVDDGGGGGGGWGGTDPLPGPDPGGGGGGTGQPGGGGGNDPYPCPTYNNCPQMPGDDGWQPVDPEEPWNDEFMIHEIINNFIDPCKNDALNSISNPDLQNFVSGFYNNFLLPTDSKIKLKFKEANNLTVNGNSVPAYSVESSTTDNNWEIYLSSNYFQQPGFNVSREIWGVILAHEILHVVIKENNLNSLGSQFDHAVIFKNFVNPVRDLLVDAFSMPADEALKLALTGMSDLWAYNNFDVLCLQEYGVTQAEINSIFDKYAKGTGGIKCN